MTHLVSLARLETQFTNLDLNNSSNRRGDISNLAVNAYLAMMKLCTPLHGEGAGAIHLVLKSLLPGVLMVGEGSGRALSVVRANSLRFVRVLMMGGGRPVCEAVAVLVQHLSVRVPDKAEFRREAAEAIVTLMSGLPSDLYTASVRWFVRYFNY